MTEEHNPFDNMGGMPDPEDVKLQAAKDSEKWARIDHLIHKTFSQNAEGAELLAEWKHALIMVPTVTENSTQFQVGIREGEKSFIRQIILTIEKVEKH